MKLLLIAFAALAHAEDRIDLQWSICAPHAEDVAARLKVDADPKKASVTYYDSVPVAYIDLGLTFRVKDKKKGSESSVKMRFHDTTEVKNSECEWDRYGDKETYTCEVTGDDIADTDPWTKAQVKFAEDYERVSWDDLRAFGPYPTLAWKSQLLGHDFTLDTVNPPKGLASIIEFSVKVPYSRKEAVYAEVTSELKARGVVLCERQESKTIRLFRQLGLKK